MYPLYNALNKNINIVIEKMYNKYQIEKLVYSYGDFPRIHFYYIGAFNQQKKVGP